MLSNFGTGRSTNSNDETMTTDLTINSCTEKYYSDADEYQTLDVKNSDGPSDAVKEHNITLISSSMNNYVTTVAILESQAKAKDTNQNHSTRKKTL